MVDLGGGGQSHAQEYRDEEFLYHAVNITGANLRHFFQLLPLFPEILLQVMTIQPKTKAGTASRPVVYGLPSGWTENGGAAVLCAA